MNAIIKPSLACDLDLTKIVYPIMGFPKIDGVRIINLDGRATARSLMYHANTYTTERFSKAEYLGIDGEGVLGNPTSPSACRDTTSALNTIIGEPDIVWHAFDFLRPDVIGLCFQERYKVLDRYINLCKPVGVKIIVPTLIKNEAQLIAFYNRCLAEGYEGAVFRDPLGHHKSGRCTANEGNYTRLKPSSDKEAIVLEIVEANKNNNVAKVNALGRTERSSHQENKTGKGMVGSLICLDVETQQKIRIMAGKMTHEERIYYFNHPEELIGQYVKYRSTDTGVKDAPRFGRFICIRSKADTLIEGSAMLQHNKESLDVQLKQAILNKSRARTPIDIEKVCLVGNKIYACYCELIGRDVVDRTLHSHAEQKSDDLLEINHCSSYIKHHADGADKEYVDVITLMTNALYDFHTRNDKTDLQKLVTALEDALLTGHIYLNRSGFNNRGYLNDLSGYWWAAGSGANKDAHKAAEEERKLENKQ